MDLNRVRAFANIVEVGSFTGAAEVLGTSKAAVSRALKDLEEDLGVLLLQRTTRKLSVTAAGREYYDSVKGALARIDEAGSIVRGMGQEPRGLVRISAADTGGWLLPQIVRSFVSDYPKIRIELSFTARVVDLVEEGFDLAVRSGKLQTSSLIARRVGIQISGPYASLDYLHRRGRPRTLRELADHDCVILRRPETSAGNGTTWQLFKAKEPESVAVSGPIVVDDLMASYEAVRLGLGIGLIPEFFRPKSDGLVRLLPKYATVPIPVSVVWPSRRLEPARVVLFRDVLIRSLVNEKWRA